MIDIDAVFGLAFRIACEALARSLCCISVQLRLAEWDAVFHFTLRGASIKQSATIK